MADFVDAMLDSRGSDLPPKREATNDLDSPPAQRIRHAVQPPNNSIQSILREHNRERLYVPPIAWTSRQPQLLNCHFAHQQVRLKGGALPSKSVVKSLQDRQRSKNPLLLIAGLLAPGTLESQKSDVTTLLGLHDIQSLRSRWLTFYFGHRRAADIRVDGIFSRNSPIPSLAYITFETIRSLRTKVYGRRTKNPVVNNLREIKLRSLDPQDPAQDPYIVSILIALAQAQRRPPEGSHAIANPQHECSKTPDPVRNGLSSPHSLCQGPPQMSHDTARSVKVTVLATSDIVAESIYVYSASIPAEFLNCLDAPSQSLPSHPILVQSYCIPLLGTKKWKSLKQLHRLICTGSCTLCAGSQPTHPEVTS